MLPRIPSALNPDFVPDFAESLTGDACALSEPVEHHCQICPTCGQRLDGHRCKLICARCGYYLSCADYY